MSYTSLPQQMIGGLFGPDRWSRVATTTIPDRNGDIAHTMVCADDYLTTDMWFSAVDECGYARFVTKVIEGGKHDWKELGIDPSFVVGEPIENGNYRLFLMFKLPDHTEPEDVVVLKGIARSIKTLVPTPGNRTAHGVCLGLYHGGNILTIGAIIAGLNIR